MPPIFNAWRKVSDVPCSPWEAGSRTRRGERSAVSTLQPGPDYDEGYVA